MCELFPHIGSVADDICIVRSMKTEQINHDPAHTFMNTGSIIAGRPSMGSWVLYGLGAETENLPGFVVLMSSGQGRADAADRGAAVVGGLPAEPIPGRPVQLGRATRCCTSSNPHGRRARQLQKRRRSTPSTR